MDHHIEGQKGDIDSDKVNSEFIGFYERLQAEYPGVYIKYCFADSEAQYLINGLKKPVRRKGCLSRSEIVQRMRLRNVFLR